MLCEFDAADVCRQCLRPTRFKGSLRQCCGSPDCTISKTDDGQDCLAEDAGPGTELKALLAGWPFRIVATPDCKCTRRAGYMDAKGCDWCESEEGMAEIMGFLREAAEERGLPFLDLPARLLVRRAIANARKAEAKRASEEASQAAAKGRPA